MTCAFGGTEGQQASSNALIECIQYFRHHKSFSHFAREGAAGASVRERVPSGEELKCSGRINCPTLSTKTLLVINYPHLCDPICSLNNNIISNNNVTLRIEPTPVHLVRKKVPSTLTKRL